MFGQSASTDALNAKRLLLKTQPSFSQTQSAARLIELFLHMVESVARTIQPTLSQTSLNLPALNLSRAMLGGLVNISTFFNYYTMNLTQGPVRRAARGTTWSSNRGFRSDTPAGLWSSHHLAKTRPWPAARCTERGGTTRSSSTDCWTRTSASSCKCLGMKCKREILTC